MVVLVSHAGSASIAKEGMVTPGNARRGRRTARVASAVQLTGAIADGRVRPTVEEIRRFMQRSEAKVMRLRHRLPEVARWSPERPLQTGCGLCIASQQTSRRP